MKRCARCGTTKNEAEFWRASKGAGGKLHPWCRPCLSAYNNARRKAGLADPQQAEHLRELARQRAKRSTAKLRAEVLAAYGGACACCGETTPEFLTIDHVDGGGAEHRRQLTGTRTGSSAATYRWLRMNGYPKDNYQLLCHNCNCAKGFYGACPHSLIIVG